MQINSSTKSGSCTIVRVKFMLMVWFSIEKLINRFLFITLRKKGRYKCFLKPLLHCTEITKCLKIDLTTLASLIIYLSVKHPERFLIV